MVLGIVDIEADVAYVPVHRLSLVHEAKWSQPLFKVALYEDSPRYS
jgi:hypothetical protein